MEALHPFALSGLQWLLRISWQVSVLIAFVLLVQRVFRGRMTPRRAAPIQNRAARRRNRLARPRRRLARKKSAVFFLAKNFLAARKFGPAREEAG